MRAIPRALPSVLATLLFTACADGSGGGLTGAERAAELGCHACHTESETDIAPTLRGIWADSVLLEDGRTLVVDEAHVSSLVDPSGQIVDGYDDRVPTFPMTDREIDRLVEHVRTLG